MNIWRMSAICCLLLGLLAWNRDSYLVSALLDWAAINFALVDVATSRAECRRR